VTAVAHDRRDLLRRGAGLGGAALAASGIPLLLAARKAFAANSGDAEILARAVDIERVAVLAYDRMLDSGLLEPRLLSVMRRFRDHEQEHADTVLTALTDLGGSVPAQPSDADVEQLAQGIGAMSSQADVLQVAIALELACVAAHHDAQRSLVDGKLLQSGVSIMAAEAQHLVVLRAAARQEPVPRAFETGEA
jgi:hypothetical protein